VHLDREARLHVELVLLPPPPRLETEAPAQALMPRPSAHSNLADRRQLRHGNSRWTSSSRKRKSSDYHCSKKPGNNG